MIKETSRLTNFHILNFGFTSYPLIYKIFIQTIYKVKFHFYIPALMRRRLQYILWTQCIRKYNKTQITSINIFAPQSHRIGHIIKTIHLKLVKSAMR